MQSETALESKGPCLPCTVAVVEVGVNAFPSIHPCHEPPPSFLGCKTMIQGPCKLQRYRSALQELISGRRSNKKEKEIERLWCISATITGRGPLRRELDKYSSPSTAREEKVWADKHTTVRATPSQRASDHPKATKFKKSTCRKLRRSMGGCQPRQSTRFSDQHRV